jgi:hypothetical protein
MAQEKYHASAYSFRHAKATELKNSEVLMLKKSLKLWVMLRQITTKLR